jgi:Big-like domain-containing protein/purple acid phosphatase-like protein/calcineurin-like phosphoesterase family protein
VGRVRGKPPVSERRSRLAGLLALVLTATLVLGISPADAAPSSELQRYPYLTDLVGGSVTVNFATVATGTDAAWVQWGPVGSCTANTAAATRIAPITVNGASRWQWKATITGLSGDTQYCYRVLKGSIDLLGTDASPVFRTQVPAGSTSPYSFVVFGDWGMGSESGNSHQTNLFNRMAASGARFALSTGDVPYGSGSTQTLYGDLGYASSGVFGTGGWPLAGKSVAMFNALGNHGRTLSSGRSAYLENWPSSTAASTSGGHYQIDAYASMNGTTATSYPSAWYAFDAGQIRFYILDATWSNGNPGALSMPDALYKNDYDQHWQPGRAEYQWLKADLEANRGRSKIAVFHFPMFSANGSNERSDTYLQGANSLEGLLTSNGVRLSFSGHAHHYQRSKPSALGLTTYISGAGGADLHSISCGSAQQAFTDYAIAWSSSGNSGSKCPSSVPTPTSANEVYHFIKVDVNGTNVTLTPTNENGGTFDVRTMNLAPSSDDPPTVSVTSPSAGTTVSGASVQLAATASDDQGVAGVQFRIDGANVGPEDTGAPYESTWDTTSFSNGSHTITSVARDTNNQTTTSGAVNVTVSNGGPPPTGINFVRQATGASTSGTTMNVDISATAADTLVASIAVAAGSSKQVTDVTDSTGGTWTRGPVGFQSGSNNRVEMWYRVNVPAGITRVTATLSASGVSSATVSEWSGVDDTAPVDQQAGRGNSSSTTAATPTITTTNANALVIAAINYPGAITATLTTTGFAPLSNFNSGTTTNGRAAYRIVSSPGPYGASWTLSTGSASGAAILALKGASAPPSDTEAPTVSVTSPTGGPVTGTVSLAADATDNVGVAGVQFKVDGTNAGPEDTTAPYEGSWNTTTASSGNHSITAVARDAAGNTTTSTPVVVNVDNTPAPDTTPPGVSMSAPQNGVAVKATIPVGANATDNVGVAGVQFRLDGANLGAEDASAPYSIGWDTATATEGSHSLTAIARDAAGNTQTAAVVTVTVDRTQPTVSVTAPANGGTVQGTVSLAADAADTGGGGVMSVQLQVDGTDVGSADTTVPYTASWNTTGLANGSSHTITAIATDRAANTRTSGAINVTVDNPAPEGPSFVRQSTGSISTGTALIANVNATTGDTLVASIAIAAGSSKSVASVSDSTGGAWTKGPVGFLTGANTRIEIWYRTNVPSGISSVTATISASGVASMNVSEWSGVASVSPVDRQAARGNSSATNASTPSITTTNANDVVIGAINYPGAASSTLTTSGFTALANFSAGSSTNGRAAYEVVPSTGTYQVSWTLSAASASGAAILALKGNGGDQGLHQGSTSILARRLEM